MSREGRRDGSSRSSLLRANNAEPPPGPAVDTVRIRRARLSENHVSLASGFMALSQPESSVSGRNTLKYHASRIHHLFASGWAWQAVSNSVQENPFVVRGQIGKRKQATLCVGEQPHRLSHLSAFSFSQGPGLDMWTARVFVFLLSPGTCPEPLGLR